MTSKITNIKPNTPLVTSIRNRPALHITQRWGERTTAQKEEEGKCSSPFGPSSPMVVLLFPSLAVGWCRLASSLVGCCYFCPCPFGWCRLPSPPSGGAAPPSSSSSWVVALSPSLPFGLVLLFFFTEKQHHPKEERRDRHIN